MPGRNCLTHTNRELGAARQIRLPLILQEHRGGCTAAAEYRSDGRAFTAACHRANHRAHRRANCSALDRLIALIGVVRHLFAIERNWLTIGAADAIDGSGEARGAAVSESDLIQVEGHPFAVAEARGRRGDVAVNHGPIQRR